MGNSLSGGQQVFLDKYRIIATYFVLFGHSFSYYQMTILKINNIFHMFKILA